MKQGDKIRVQYYIMGYPNGTKDFTIEKFRHCLGFFESEQHRMACKFTPLCDLFEPGPESKEKYIPNFGSYMTNQVQSWMDIPKD